MKIRIEPVELVHEQDKLQTMADREGMKELVRHDRPCKPSVHVPGKESLFYGKLVSLFESSVPEKETALRVRHDRIDVRDMADVRADARLVHHLQAFHKELLYADAVIRMDRFMESYAVVADMELLARTF